MNGFDKKFHEVIIHDDPEKRHRVAMEQNGRIYVMLIGKKSHGPQLFDKEKLEFIRHNEH